MKVKVISLRNHSSNLLYLHLGLAFLDGFILENFLVCAGVKGNISSDELRRFNSKSYTLYN